MGHFFTLEELLLVWPESAVWHQEEVVLLFKSHFNHVAFLAASKREMTASNNTSFGQLEEVGSFHRNKFNPLSLQICTFWKFMNCMSGFFLSTTELQTTQCSTIMKSKALVSKLMNAVDRLPAEEVYVLLGRDTSR